MSRSRPLALLSILAALGLACSGASTAGSNDQGAATGVPATAATESVTGGPRPSLSPELPSPTPAPPAATPAPTRAARPPAPLAAVPQTKRAGPMDVTLVVIPGRAGYNEVNLYFFDANDLWTGVESVGVRLVYVDFGGVTFSERAAPLHPGHVVVGGSQMQHSGHWRIEGEFSGPGLSGLTVAFDVLIP
jgi:hypothetical protein